LWPVLTRLELPDGDFVQLDWAGRRGPIVIALPGLQGDIEAAYVRGLLRACESRG
jgi:predicted alpha/beta-fold hydrolase